MTTPSYISRVRFLYHYFVSCSVDSVSVILYKIFYRLVLLDFLFFFFLMTRPPPRSPLFPYTPLFRSDQCVALGLDERPEALAHRREPQQLGERVPVPRVLGAVVGQHARPDDLSGREARIVDGECLRVAHHLERRLAAGDEPAVQNRHPPDRAQRRENRMRIRLELLQRDLGGHAVDSTRAGRAGTGIRVQSQGYALVSSARLP